MNQVFAGGLALIIALILWSTKKQSKASSFFKSQKDSFSKAQVESSSLVIDKNFETQKSTKLDKKTIQGILFFQISKGFFFKGSGRIILFGNR